MDKSIQQTVDQRREQVKQIKSSFQNQIGESNAASSTFGIRTIFAILIFTAFVYCDQEQITYEKYSTKEVFSQIEWNPLPINKIVEGIRISKQQSIQPMENVLY
ncbi:MAG: hypothetical protein RSD28_04105 [Lachnospiraceae bacterium]